MKLKTFLIPIMVFSGILSCNKIEGCTNPNASNYDATAEKDDGSCVFEPTQVYISSVTATPTASEQVTIKNNSGTTQDLTGWIIGDANNPNAYTIPSMSLDQGYSHTFPGTTLGFGINDSGETIYLKNSSGSTVDTWSN